MGRRRTWLTVLAGVLFVAMAGCSSEDGGGDEQIDATSAPDTTSASDTTSAPTNASEPTGQGDGTPVAAPTATVDLSRFEQGLATDTEAYTEFVEVSDDSGRLTMVVPAEWTDVRGDGGEGPSLQASPGASSAAIGGVPVVAVALPSNPSGRTDDLALEVAIEGAAGGVLGGAGVTCEERDFESFSDHGFEGRLKAYLDCDGQGWQVIFVAGTAEGGDDLTLVFGIIPTVADLDAFEQVLSTFEVA